MNQSVVILTSVLLFYLFIFHYPFFDFINHFIKKVVCLSPFFKRVEILLVLVSRSAVMDVATVTAMVIALALTIAWLWLWLRLWLCPLTWIWIWIGKLKWKWTR